MITVGGFNTAIERFADTDALRPGEVIRATNVRVWPGGKGLHVAQAVAELGEPVRLVGIIDEMHTAWFHRFLEQRRVEFRGVPVAGPIRTCLALRDASGAMTEVLEPGPDVTEEIGRALCGEFSRSSADGGVSVLSGSLPPGLTDDTYAKLILAMREEPVRILLDASGSRLRFGAAARPFAIKPNRREAEELGEAALADADAVLALARRITHTGVPLVVISLGDHGIVAAWGDRSFRVTPPVVRSVNSVGAGDCLLAGLAVGVARQMDPEDVLRLAVACGSAKVLTEETGMLRRDDVERLSPQVRVASA